MSDMYKRYGNIMRQQEICSLRNEKMRNINDEIIERLKERSIFSEYLPKNFCMDYKDYNIYNAGGSHKDIIEPYLYSMSRLTKKGARRTISIPNASAYVAVINYLAANNDIIEEIVNLSANDEGSFSRIVDSNKILIDNDGVYDRECLSLQILDDGDRSLEEEKKRSVFVENMLYKIERTKGACGILHIDISEFYGSIYTHAITAINLGIDGALEAFYNKSQRKDYKIYKNLDCMIRGLNGKRTNGLLIGPYLSKVIAEAVLSKVDEELRSSNLVFTRYADDYEFAIYNISEIDAIKTRIVSIFDRFFFKINNEKTYFESYPFYLFSNFERVLGRTEEGKEDIEITELFNKFWKLEMNGEKGAVRYLLKSYQGKYTIKDNEVYCNYLINVLSNDEKALALSCKILIEEYNCQRICINDSTKGVLLTKLENEFENKHEWETIWLVYLLKKISCDIPSDIFEKLWQSDFQLLKVLMIHEYQIDKEKLRDCFFKSDSWLLLYEIAVSLGDFEMFADKLSIKNSRNFYQKLFEKNYRFYK